MAHQVPPPPPPPEIPGQPPAGQRPSSATTSAILLFTVGGIRGLLAVITVALVLGAQDEISDLQDGDLFLGIVFGVVAAMAVAAALQIAAGVHTLAMRSKGWALGVGGTIIGLVLGVLSFAGASSGSAPGNLIIVILLFVGDIVILVNLAQARRFMTPS